MGITDITDITTQILSKTRIPKTNGFCMVCQHFCNHPSMISFGILFQHLPTKKEIGPHQTDDLMAWFCVVKLFMDTLPQNESGTLHWKPRKLKGKPRFSPPHLWPTRHRKVVNKAPFVAYPFLWRLKPANNRCFQKKSSVELQSWHISGLLLYGAIILRCPRLHGTHNFIGPGSPATAPRGGLNQQWHKFCFVFWFFRQRHKAGTFFCF